VKLASIALVFLLAAAAARSARPAPAAEDTLAFVHALQEKGYADQAAEYLAGRKASGDLPPELAAVYDLEMAKCLDALARRTRDAGEAGQQRAAAKDHLAAFLQAYPTHRRVPEAMRLLVDISIDAAIAHWQAARDPVAGVDVVGRAAELAATRAALKDAQSRLVEITEKCCAQAKAITGHQRNDTMLRADWSSQGKVAAIQAVVCNEYLAQTYEDPKDSTRRKILENAAEQSDKLFQADRGTWLGLCAHLCQGRIASELGQLELAADILDEVLVGFETEEPFRFTRETAWFYAQAKRLRLDITARQSAKTEPASLAARQSDGTEAAGEPALGQFSVAAWETVGKVLSQGGKGIPIRCSCGSYDHTSDVGVFNPWLYDALKLGSFGGTMATQHAVAAALQWLTRHQGEEGNWSFRKYTAQCTDESCTGADSAASDAGATGMALLCYLGAGQTHKSRGPYRMNIERGLVWLVRHQEHNGNLGKDCACPMYSHAMATMALCEAFGLSGDRNVGMAAQGAVNFILAAQNKKDCGWGSHAGDAGDMVATVWQIMALKSAQMAGLNVGGSGGSGSIFDLAGKWLDAVKTGPNGSQFRAQPGSAATPAASAMGLLCRQYLGAKRTDPLMADGVRYLLKNLPEAKIQDVTYAYYGTLVLHNYSGREWDTWNRAVRKLLTGAQTTDSTCANGSWDPGKRAKEQRVAPAGRLMATALSCLTLEVYYRYLPLYKVDAE
jgi:hypothetical protein